MPLSRFGRRHERTFGKEKEEWDGDFRKPPKPDSYYTTLNTTTTNATTLNVKEDGTINERRSWHEDCATEYMLIYHSKEQRAHVRKRDKGQCNHCGVKAGRWDVDHIKPLWEQKGVSAEDLDMSYYSLDNLQTLCKKCHKKKTAEEHRIRAKTKKQEYSKVKYKETKKWE